MFNTLKFFYVYYYKKYIHVSYYKYTIGVPKLQKTILMFNIVNIYYCLIQYIKY